jgi:predicted SnoaL-like aldol condensation-catalyzing enzyme
MTPPLHERTIAIQKSIETGQLEPLSWFDSRTYIQHNPLLGDGFASLLQFLDSLPKGTSRVHAYRAFTDGDISVAHLEYHLAPMGHLAGFEVHRWEDDRIVEHWDNLQPIPEGAAPAMFDGATEVTDQHLTAENKAVVREFVNSVLIGGRVETLDRYVADSGYRDHHPGRDDRSAALVVDIISGRSTYRRLHRVLGAGNFVLAMSEGVTDNAPAAFYDLFRIEGGRIVEHWDVVEALPPRNQWANDNGKF